MDKTEVEALLPCPFCGGEAKMIGCMGAWKPEGYEPMGRRIVCVSDNCSGSGMPAYGDGMEDAAASNWNRRTPPPAGDTGEAIGLTVEMIDAGRKAIADERKRVGQQYPDTLAILAYEAMAPLAPHPSDAALRGRVAEAVAAEREACAAAAENACYAHDIDWWLTATKKEVSEDACRQVANLIRARAHTGGET